MQQGSFEGSCPVQIPHHAIQNVSFNWDDHDKFLPGERSFQQRPRQSRVLSRITTCEISSTRHKRR